MSPLPDQILYFLAIPSKFDLTPQVWAGVFFDREIFRKICQMCENLKVLCEWNNPESSEQIFAVKFPPVGSLDLSFFGCQALHGLN